MGTGRSHAHTDRIGGAEIIQKKYGVGVVIGALDRDTVEKYPNRYNTMARSVTSSSPTV